MRSRSRSVLLLAASASLAVLFASNVASSQTVMHLKIPTDGAKARQYDNYNDGMRLGDRLAARGVLVDSAGAEVGTAYLDCMVGRRLWDGETGLWSCNYVLDLEDGDIVIQGLDPRGAGTYEMAILGGTGAHAGASGDATFTDTAEATEIVMTLDG